MPLYLLGALAGALLSIALNELLEAQKPSPVREPYEPPFEGGQCITVYQIYLDFKGFRYGNPFLFSNQYSGNIFGAIKGLEFDKSDGNILGYRIIYIDASGIQRVTGTTTPPSGDVWQEVSINRVVRADGLLDNCGNLPNPNPILPINDSGYAIPPNPIPNPSNPGTPNYSPELAYSPIVLAPSGALAAAAAALAAAIGALASAVDVVDLATKIGDYFLKKDAYDKEVEKEKEREKEKEGKPVIKKIELGSISNDGMISFDLIENENEATALFLDIDFTNIPKTMGRYFGLYSPNRHIYDMGLGYIAFYSYSFGIIQSTRLEYRRNSVLIPNGAYGFFYHLGLSTLSRANARLIYSVKNEA